MPFWLADGTDALKMVIWYMSAAPWAAPAMRSASSTITGSEHVIAGLQYSKGAV